MNADTVKQFATIFRGRTDCWGALHGECVREKLTLDHYRQQLEGEKSLGIYPVRPDDTCYWASADFDNDDVEAARRLMDALYSLGINTGVWLERSKSKGWHVWLFLDAAAAAKDVRLLLRAALKKASLPPAIEIFPKQNSLSETPDRIGNYIHLPYYGNGGDGRRQFCDTRTLAPIALETFLHEHTAFPVDLLPLVVESLPPELRASAEKKAASEIGDVIPYPERNRTLFSLAGTMQRRGFGHEAILAALLEENALKCQPALLDAEVERIAQSITRYAPAEDAHYPEAQITDEASRFPRTDTGNAELFAQLHGDRLRYDHRRKRWLLWASHWWEPDADAEVQRLARQTARYRYQTAASIADLKEREAEARWAIGSENRMRLDAALYLAQAERPIADAGNKWDSDPYLMGVGNGVLDLHSGQLRGGRQDDWISMRSPVCFDPSAQYPRWLDFLSRIMDGNPQLIAFLQRAVGYSLTGSVSEQAIFFAYGTGANGKSTFLGAVLDVLGDYGCQAAPGLLLRKHNDTHPTELADLAGRRFVASVEVEESRRLAEALVKWLTGGDRMKARRMRQDFFEFTPTYKIFLAANHKPTISGTDLAIWRRIELIPFTVIIPLEEQDKELPAKLGQELPGILNWALEGCLEWQRHGLNPPPEVQAATEAYRAEQDVLAAFINECCVTGPEQKVTAHALYFAYSNWCKDSGEKAMSKKAFGIRLEERGFTPGRTEDVRGRHGIGLLVGGER